MRQTVAEARKTVDLLQRMTEQELFATRDRVERAELLEEHSALRRIDDVIAQREEAEAERRHEAWLRMVKEEFRLAQLLGHRPFIQRRRLNPRQKAALLRLLGRSAYRFLPW
jgi:hypothetical protein